MISLIGSKLILALTNFLLLGCGFTLVTGAMLVLFDPERILLSKLLAAGPFSDLPHPMLYYVAIGLALLGLSLAAAGILGCWASCLHNYWLLSIYFLLVMAVLVGECAIYAVTWLWPQCMGLGIDAETMVKSLQRNYGVSGQDQFTAAVDLAQTTFRCCGINSANEYDTSLWRLQALGSRWLFPYLLHPAKYQRNCRLFEPESRQYEFMPSSGKNIHNGFRYTEGCQLKLEQWYREHYVAFLGIGLAVVLVEFFVLLSTILTCTRVYHHNQEQKENAKNTAQDSDAINTKDRIFQKKGSLTPGAYSNETYAMTDSYRQNYKLLERA